MSDDRKQIVVAITGASGSRYGVRILEVLRDLGVTSHLVISKAGALAIRYETGLSVSDVKDKADIVHSIGDIGASIASGSYQTMGMIVAPCSIKTMSEISTGVTGNLISRAADVALKERRRLVLMLRETPLHLGHLRSATQISEMGGTIFPPVPAFYANPKSIEDVIDHSVGRVLDIFGLESDILERWQGEPHADM